MSLWQQYREFNCKPAIIDVNDFIIVNSNLHEEFDRFKKEEEVKPSHSFVLLNELLLFYSLPQVSTLYDLPKVYKFGKCYLELHMSRVDEFISWIIQMRQRYNVEGEDIFLPGVQSLLSNGNNYCVLHDYLACVHYYFRWYYFIHHNT